MCPPPPPSPPGIWIWSWWPTLRLTGPARGSARWRSPRLCILAGHAMGSGTMAVHRSRTRGGGGLPQNPLPPSPDQSDHRGKKRNLQSGKSGQAIFGTQNFGSKTPSPPPPPKVTIAGKRHLPSGKSDAGAVFGPSGAPAPPRVRGSGGFGGAGACYVAPSLRTRGVMASMAGTSGQGYGRLGSCWPPLGHSIRSFGPLYMASGPTSLCTKNAPTKRGCQTSTGTPASVPKSHDGDRPLGTLPAPADRCHGACRGSLGAGGLWYPPSGPPPSAPQAPHGPRQSPSPPQTSSPCPPPPPPSVGELPLVPASARRHSELVSDDRMPVCRGGIP